MRRAHRSERQMATKNRSESERQFVRRVLIVLALTTLFFLAWQLRTLILMLFGAVVVATVFRAVADRMCKLTGIPNRVAVPLAILLVLGIVAAMIAIFGAQVAQQIETLRDALPAAWR